MKNYFLLISIFFAYFLTACKGSPDSQPHFPIEETLTQELMPLQGITTPGIVEIKYPFLIVENMKQKDSLFHIYDLRDRQLKTVFGTKGGGPNEFSTPWMIHSQLSDLVIANKNSFYHYEVDANGYANLTRKQAPLCDNSIYEAAFINDSTFVVDAQYMAPDIYLYTMQDKDPLITLSYRNPDIMDMVRDPNYGHVYANGDRIILAYEYKKEIDFMDTAFNLIKKVKFDFPTSDESLLGMGDCNSAYTYGYLGKRYFYVNYFGTSWKQCRENDTRDTYIEVYDLDGMPVARYFLDGKRPTYFAVDEKNFILYGATLDGTPEDNLLMYSLKGLE